MDSPNARPPQLPAALVRRGKPRLFHRGVDASAEKLVFRVGSSTSLGENKPSVGYVLLALFGGPKCRGSDSQISRTAATDVCNVRIRCDGDRIIDYLVDPCDIPCSGRASVSAVHRNAGDLGWRRRLDLGQTVIRARADLQTNKRRASWRSRRLAGVAAFCSFVFVSL